MRTLHLQAASAFPQSGPKAVHRTGLHSAPLQHPTQPITRNLPTALLHVDATIIGLAINLLLPTFVVRRSAL
jgi:hypothetical protein